jgi:class 3 adenylate cyclase/tetratricopeptide (TPR) repeat protein
MSDLRQWLEQHGLGNFAALLAENEVDLEILPELDEADLERIGLALGPRKKLLKAIRELDPAQFAHPAPASSARPASSGEAERRQLTVMFADLVGSTELSQSLDPEDLREINRSYQDTATAAIEKFGGYVARYMGDGVLAYFGYPLAHEDDAERALRAGLELVDAVPALETGVALAVRVGVATGAVVVGDIVGQGASQESAVVGETPNLAARLQGIAEPNTVVLSAATEHLISGRFDLVALGPQTLKGIAAPVPAYRALAVRRVSRFDAARERRLTPVVGRDEELGMLLRRWKSAVDGEGQAVLLSGEAGVGKSRIVRALQDSLAESLTNRVLCYCSSYQQISAFQPVIEQLERAARIRPGQAPREKLSSLENVLADLGLKAVETVQVFAELLSIPYEGTYPALQLAPEQMRLRLLDVLVETTQAMAAREPLLFVVEDAHWIDPSTQEFLTHLIERLGKTRTLVVITHRPEYPSPWSSYSHVTAIALSNLGRRDTAAMVAAMTRGRGLPASMIEEIIDRTDGVPLFIEEITAALTDTEGNPKGDGAGAETVDATTTSIPATLQDLLMERLDRLGSAKEFAQLAAVIGRSFTFDLMKAVSSQDEQGLAQSLTRLVQSGLIYGRGGAGSTYEFKHALVRDAAYQSLLKRERQRCHQRIAAALLQSADDNLPLELLAHHFAEGGHFDEAARYWRQAGERALGRFAHVEAISDFRRALTAAAFLPENGDRLRFELETQMLLGPSLMFVLGQGAPEVEHTYARALELGEQLGDSRASFISAWGMWRLQFARGDMKAGHEYALKSQQVSADAIDLVAELGTAFALGATYLFSGDYCAADPHLEHSIDVYRKMEDKSGLAVFGQDPGLSSLCIWLGHAGVLAYPTRRLSRVKNPYSWRAPLASPCS